jgi:putative serine protease PepD
MVNDPGTRTPPTNGRLWTDPREEDEAQPWLKPRTPVVAQPPLRAPEDPGDGDDGRRRRLIRNGLLATMAVFALLGAGFLVNSVFFGGDDAPQRATLPAIPGAAPADQRSRTVRAIYASVSPSVVSVRVTTGGATDSGTGFIIDAGGSDGTIVTNAHVVGDATTAQVNLDDKASAITARVVGKDESTDLAVLKVDRSAISGRRPLALAESNDVQVGDLAIAIGYPFGLERTATAGIVSGIGRTINAPNNFQIDKVIQTDAPINPGNSGGPLLDSAGRVVGVNSQIATTTGGNVGIGFAIPSDTVRTVVPRLEGGATIKRAYLGVGTEPALATNGALVGSVVPSGPADAAGLKDGDIITSIGGTSATSPEDVSAAIDARKPGDSVDIVVQRDGSSQTFHVKLGTRPSTAASGYAADPTPGTP